MLDNPVPEIQRCNLSNVILQLMAIGVRNVASFDFMDKPSEESMKAAFVQLNLLQATEGEADTIQLTQLGNSNLPFSEM